MKLPVRGQAWDVLAVNWFLYRLNAPRPDFAFTMSESEQQVMGEHFAYWTEILDRGQCLIFSPVADPAGVWGAAVVKGESAADIEALGAGDPAVVAGTCSFEVMQLLSPVTRA